MDSEEGKPLLGADGSSRMDHFPVHGSATGRNAQLMSMIRAALAEFMATTFFVMIGVTAVRNPGADLVSIALAHGLMIFLMVSVTGHISGGHVNPAVTLGLFLSGEIGLIRLALYWVAQILGGILGAAFALGLSNDLYDINYGAHNTAGPELIFNGQAFVVEMFTTCVLVLTVHVAAVDPKGPKALTPFCIGMAVAAGILATGSLTGGSMNPARSFGPAFISLNALDKHSNIYPSVGNHQYWYDFWKPMWIYIFGPLFGGSIASVIYRFLLSSERLPAPHITEPVN